MSGNSNADLAEDDIMPTLTNMTPDRRQKWVKDIKQEQKYVRFSDVKAIVKAQLAKDGNKDLVEILDIVQSAILRLEKNFKQDIVILQNQVSQLEDHIEHLSESRGGGRKRGRFGKRVEHVESMESASLITKGGQCLFCNENSQCLKHRTLHFK